MVGILVNLVSCLDFGFFFCGRNLVNNIVLLGRFEVISLVSGVDVLGIGIILCLVVIILCIS